MAKKKPSAEAENPMLVEAESGPAWMDGETSAEPIGQGAGYDAQPMEQDGTDDTDGNGSGFPPDASPGAVVVSSADAFPGDGGPLFGGDAPDFGGLSPNVDGPLFGGNGPYSGSLSPSTDSLPPDESGLYSGEDNLPLGGLPSDWTDNPDDSGGYTGNSPGIAAMPAAVPPYMQGGIEDTMRGSEPDGDGEDGEIPYNGNVQPDNPPPSDGSLSGAAEAEDESGGALTEAVPPASAKRPRRRRNTADSAGTMNGAEGETASGFRAPAPTPTAPTAPAPAASARSRASRQSAGNAADRAAFFGLQFNRLDRNLTPEERQEWNSIYASYRGGSVMSGTISGVEPANLLFPNLQTGVPEERMGLVAVVIPYRVRILIPEYEMWFPGEERPDFVMGNMEGAKIDFVITEVDRKLGAARASRVQTLPHRRYYFSTQPQLNTPGSRIQCNVLAVGPRRCLVNCHGYDLDMTQRDLSWKSIPDLKEVYHNGDTLDCIVKEYNSRQNHLVVSVKETMPNPFDGADFRNPEGCRRIAVITGKYGGGVFCTLMDDVTVMCNYAFQYDDQTFSIGDRVLLVVERYEYEKKQVYGKIVAKR